MAGGRPTDYTSELADLICERLATESMLKICMDPEMPAQRTIYNWLLRHPEFMLKYREAREAQAHYMADVASHMGMHGDIYDAPAAAVRLNAIKWAASKLAGKHYGEKSELNIGGTDGAPLTVVIKEYPAPA
jgi:hypothetical protein